MPTRAPSLTCAAIAVLALAGCGGSAPPAASPAANDTRTEQERSVDRLGAASAAGYDGDAVKDSVKGSIDERNRQTAAAAEAAEAASSQ